MPKKEGWSRIDPKCNCNHVVFYGSTYRIGPDNKKHRTECEIFPENMDLNKYAKWLHYNVLDMQRRLDEAEIQIQRLTDRLNKRRYA